MELCELRKLAGASSLSDVSNVVYSNYYWVNGLSLCGRSEASSSAAVLQSTLSWVCFIPRIGRDVRCCCHRTEETDLYFSTPDIEKTTFTPIQCINSYLSRHTVSLLKGQHPQRGDRLREVEVRRHDAG